MVTNTAKKDQLIELVQNALERFNFTEFKARHQLTSYQNYRRYQSSPSLGGRRPTEGPTRPTEAGPGRAAPPRSAPETPPRRGGPTSAAGRPRRPTPPH